MYVLNDNFVIVNCWCIHHVLCFFFSNKQCLVRHMKNHKTDNKTKTSANALYNKVEISHIEIEYRKNLLKCEQCHFVTTRLDLLKRHQKVHPKIARKQRKFQCEMCDFSTMYKKNMPRHMKIHTNDKEFKCELCNYHSRYKNDVERHKKITHSKRDSISCEHCEYCAPHALALKRHLLIHGKVTKTDKKNKKR